MTKTTKCGMGRIPIQYPKEHYGPEVKILLEALEKIRDADYRGNRSTESQVASTALQQFSEARGE